MVVMTIVLLYIYNQSLGADGQYSLATAQSRLQEFYYDTLGMLAAVITLVAPSMGAFAIVSEKQRRSLDLVFSAPTEPKYYLVGKLISSYRYVWLLLVLSLPFCAVSVTLGGTTWSQLFITFFLYSMYGLVCVSFGLLMSTLCSKVLPAIIWTYAALACYLIATFALTAASSASSYGSFLKSVNPIFSLNPICYSFAADQTWPVFGHDVPTWILTTIMHLLVVKFIVLAAGSLLAPGNSKEIRGLRIHALAYIAPLVLLSAASLAPVFASYSSLNSARANFGTLTADQVLQVYHGRSLFGILFLLGILVVPYLASFGYNDLRRHRPDGFFNFRELFSGRPSGHLPFLLLLLLTTVVAYGIGGSLSSLGTTLGPVFSPRGTPTSEKYNPFSPYFLMYVALIIAIWLIAFLVGWYASSRRPILSKGRTISLFFFVLALILPTALFSIVTPEDTRSATGLWALSPIAGVTCDIFAVRITGFHSVIYGCIAVLLLLVTIPSVAKCRSRNFENRLEDRDDSNKEVPAL